MKIPFFFSQREHKHLKKKIISSISKSLIHGKTLQGPEVSNLELKLAKYIGTKYAIAVGSCTDALFFSLKAINIKEGDEVIVTSYSYLASATCILRCGAVPVFVDVNENGNMDLNQIKKKFTSKTRAIIYVHLFGYQENISKLLKFIKKKNIYLIEDFAQAFGAKYKNSHAGSFGDISCTSFDPTKVLSAPGSGGMAFTNNKFLRDRIVKLRYHGKNKGGENDSLGINSQLPTLVAATLLVKFKLLEKNKKIRINIAKFYFDRLKNLKIKLPPVTDNQSHIYHKFVIQCKRRNHLMKYLEKNGVETMIHYKKSIKDLSIFKKYKTLTPVADLLSKQSISLPIHPYLKKKELNYIVRKIKYFFDKNY